MTTIVPFLQDAAFDQHDIDAMSTALIDVCNALKLDGKSTAQEVVAVRIIELARRGERRPTKLRDRLLREAGSSL